MSDAAPEISVNMVRFDVWPYGNALWIERRVEGIGVEVLNAVLTGGYRYSTIASAALRTGGELRDFGIRLSQCEVQVHEHAAARRAPVLANTLQGTQGEVIGRGVEIHFGGACPVQGYGTVDKHPIYYRARGSGWTMAFFAPGTDVHADGPLPQEIFEFGQLDAYAWPDGGWLEASESVLNIEAAIENFRRTRP